MKSWFLLLTTVPCVYECTKLIGRFQYGKQSRVVSPERGGLSWIMHKGEIWRTDPNEPNIECVRDFFGPNISLALHDSPNRCPFCAHSSVSNITDSDQAPMDTPERTRRAMMQIREMFAGAHISMPGANLSEGQYSPEEDGGFAELQREVNNLKLADKPKRKRVKRNLQFFIPPSIPTRFLSSITTTCINLRGGGNGAVNRATTGSDPVDHVEPVRITLKGYAPVCDVRTMRPDFDNVNRFLPRAPQATMEISAGQDHFIGHIWDKNEKGDAPATINSASPEGYRKRKRGEHNLASAGSRIHKYPEGPITEHGKENMQDCFEDETDSTEPLSGDGEQDLNLRVGDTAIAMPGPCTLRPRAPANPFLASEDSDSDAAGHSDAEADPASGHGPGAAPARVLAAQRAINELLNKERRHFLAAAPAPGYGPGQGEGAAGDGGAPHAGRVDELGAQLQAELDAELWRAARAGATAQATLALSRGARADAGDEGFFGWTALHRAADKGCDAVAGVLVHYGATVDRPEAARGLTALHLAAHQGRFEAAQVLLDAGADPRRPDAGGVTALELARANAWRSPRHRDLEVLLLASVAAHDGGPGRLAPVTDWWAAVQGGGEGEAGRHSGPGPPDPNGPDPGWPV